MENHAILEDNVKEILVNLGENLSRKGLKRTPARVAHSLLYLTSGNNKDIKKIVNGAVFRNTSKKMVLVKDIPFFSLCEHHLLPFFGKMHIAYVPNGRIIGLSKIPRIVDIFSKRLQIQERLTEQIAEAISKIIKPKGIIVLVKAKHFCIMMRGVQKQDVSVITHHETGIFRDNAKASQDFFNLINKESFNK